ncbi:aminoglycoside phosphotransferase family protein [Candidatus Woesearchaeota archaeon]|nr:aminoglycoside phosphotransferase family protein [Candidatus Woesearchaeota archaeon]
MDRQTLDHVVDEIGRREKLPIPSYTRLNDERKNPEYVLDIGTHVVRVVATEDSNDWRLDRPQREAWALQTLAAQAPSVPVPRFVSQGRFANGTVVSYNVVTKLSGEPLDTAKPLYAHGRQLAEHMLAMHSIALPGCGYVEDGKFVCGKDWPKFVYGRARRAKNGLQFYNLLNQETEALLDEIIERIPSYAASSWQLSLLHHDLRSPNVHVSNGTVTGILDLASAIGGAIESEFALSKLPQPVHEAFMETYTKHRPLHCLYDTQAALYELLDNLHHVVALADSGSPDAKRAMQHEAQNIALVAYEMKRVPVR